MPWSNIVIVDCSLVYFTKRTISIFPKLVTEMAFYVHGVSAPCLELRFFIAKKQIDSLYTFWSLNIILFFSFSPSVMPLFSKPSVFKPCHT